MGTDAKDIAIARHLKQMGLASPEQIAQAVEEQGRLHAKSQYVSLADAFVRIGILTPAIRDNLDKQLRIQQKQKAKTSKLLHYRLVKKIGQGGMGAVYLAVDTKRNKRVALKILPKKYNTDSQFIKRFEREARAAGELTHPNIVRAFDAGEAKGYHFYVMEYCEGETLDQMIKRYGLLPVEQATEVTLHAARGLQYAHAHGVVHRDVKPANIILASDGTAKILDLGLSKKIDESQLSFQTLSGAVLGTPQYMSPEQASAERDLDGRSDVYSLGATYYHLLTGEPPFGGGTLYEILSKQVNAKIPNPQDLAEGIPDGVVHVIRKMMAKNPKRRYPSCAELVVDLEEVLEGREPKSAAVHPAESMIANLRKQRSEARRKRVAERRAPKPPGQGSDMWVWLLGGIAVGILVLIVIILLSRGGGRTRRQPPPPRTGSGLSPLKKPTSPPGIKAKRAALDAELNVAMGRRDFRAALNLLDSARRRHAAGDWKLALDRKVGDVKVAARKALEPIKARAILERRAGLEDEVARDRTTVNGWNLPELSVEFRRALAEVSPVAAVPPKLPVKPPTPPPLTVVVPDPGKLHQVSLKRSDGIVSMTIDGQPIEVGVTVTDPFHNLYLRVPADGECAILKFMVTRR